jgi:hypothetical protein
MINANFEFISNLQFTIKALEARVRAFESGERYITMQEEHDKQIAAQNRVIRDLRLLLADANAQIVTNRQNTFQVYEDMEKTHAADMAKKVRELRAMEKRALRAEEQRDKAIAELREKKQELYQALTDLEEERALKEKLIAVRNRDHENSSIPSSQQSIKRKKIANSREKTGRKPGGQPGHAGHRRRRLEPTDRVNIPAPEKYANNPQFRLTGRAITKQLISLQIATSVTEYSTPEYRNLLTGQRVHADFPVGVVNDVNYDGNIKSLAFLLSNRYNVSTDRIADLLSELTDGHLKISKGMINGLSKEFNQKADAIMKEAIDELYKSPVVHVDFTPVRLNGKYVQVLVCATSKLVLFFVRKQKGHEGVKGTPLENIVAILVHDHDMTFYRYGIAHQECLEHVLRALTASMENEGNLTWNKLMWELIREMIHSRNILDPNSPGMDPDLVRLFEARYDEILDTAYKEYEYEPPGKYNRDGQNLSIRLRKYRDSHLLFLHDIRVPPTNNNAERPIRSLKRKQAQAMTFRSFDGVDYLCQSLSLINLMRQNEDNLYRTVSSVFGLLASD